MKEDKREARIAHIKAHVESGKADVAVLQGNISRKFNVSNSLGLLSEFARANAMLAWFAHQDATCARKWALRAAMTDFNTTSVQEGLRQPYPMFLSLFWPLLANDAALVVNYLQLSSEKYSKRRIDDLRTDEHLLDQFGRALAGDFESLLRNSTLWLAQEKLSKNQLLNKLDYDFLGALSGRNIQGMQVALASMVEPSEIRRHKNFESGYTADLFSSKAFIYAKLAWYHGFQIDIKSEYIPTVLLGWDEKCVYSEKWEESGAHRDI